VPVDWNSLRFPTKTLKGMGGEMSIYGLNVGFKAETFEDYNSRMAISEQIIINELGTDRIREVI
jgi:thymidine kinase